ncbi:hypothetical protein FRC08_004749, partial [Ceratobasidium sp. 394]
MTSTRASQLGPPYPHSFRATRLEPAHESTGLAKLSLYPRIISMRPAAAATNPYLKPTRLFLPLFSLHRRRVPYSSHFGTESYTRSILSSSTIDSPARHLSAYDYINKTESSTEIEIKQPQIKNQITSTHIPLIALVSTCAPLAFNPTV